MKFVKKALQRPHLEDILMATGNRPRNESQAAFWPKKLQYPCTKFSQIAKAIGSTSRLVKRELLIHSTNCPVQ